MVAYATSDDLVARYPSLDAQDLDEIDAILEAASRWIDGRCHRRFDLDDTPTVRLFSAGHPYVLDLGAFEIGATGSVTVETDDGSGSFATTVDPAEYQLEPVNAAYAAPEPRPFTTIRRLAGRWPRARSEQGRQELVRVTARYGWPAVPAAVREACLLLGNEEFENPGGLSGESIDGYSWRASAADDDAAPAGIRTARRKLGPYVRSWAA